MQSPKPRLELNSVHWLLLTLGVEILLHQVFIYMKTVRPLENQLGFSVDLLAHEEQGRCTILAYVLESSQPDVGEFSFLRDPID
jgi:hypothetical protein